MACRATSESATEPVKTVGEKAERSAREDQSDATMEKKNRGKRVQLSVKEVFDFALYESTDQPRPPTF